MAQPLMVVAVVALIAVVGYRVEQTSMARNLPLGNVLRKDGFNPSDFPDLSGKVAVVTGATSGLGKATALQLARLGATVVMGCRDTAKGDSVRAEIAAALPPGASLRVLPLDLADLSSVEIFAARLVGDYSSTGIHALINNAGIGARYPAVQTANGIEMTFQVNFVGHFVLTKALLGPLEAAGGANVVWLSSNIHSAAPAGEEWLTLDWHNDFGEFGLVQRYAVAKLATLWAAKEFNQRHGGTRTRVFFNAVHPGIVATNILGDPAGPAEFIIGPVYASALGKVIYAAKAARDAVVAYSAERASLTPLFAAVSPRIQAEARGGEYFVPIATPWAPAHPSFSVEGFGDRFWRFATDLAAKSK